MTPALLVHRLFTPALLEELGTLVDLDPADVLTDPATAPAARARLAEAEVLIAGWGAPKISPADAPNLRAVVYLGGVAATCLTDLAGWSARGLVAANTRAANAVPVAEYALAMILLSGKHAFDIEQDFRRRRTLPEHHTGGDGPGNHGRTIGIVGVSATARVLIEYLCLHDISVVAHDPYLDASQARTLGIELTTLDEVMARGDVVSLHQALTPETTGQIGAEQLALMADGATLLNTARGAVVDTDALTAELRTGRIRAILDVTDPEPLPPDHELWTLPGVVLTPHLAGSLGGELHRMGRAAVDEVRRFTAGEPFAHPEHLPASDEGTAAATGTK